MSVSKTPVTGGYFAERDFINTKTSLIISLFEYIENIFFPNEDGSRVIYASNDFAFRRRNQLLTSTTSNHRLTTQNLNLPFVNFYMTGLSPNVNRQWKNNQLEVNGVMDWILDKKIKISPMKINFEATIFTEKETDLHFAMSQIFWEGGLETVLKPQLSIDNNDFSNIAVINFDRSFSNNYSEKDWLEKNKIRATSIDFDVDTYLVRTNSEGFCIPKTVLFSFSAAQDIESHSYDDYDSLLSGVINHLDETVSFD